MGRRTRRRPSIGQKVDRVVESAKGTASKISDQCSRPQAELRKLQRVHPSAEELKNGMINKILQVDDGVQSFVRTKALGLMDDGSMLPQGKALGTVREMLGGTVFTQRPGAKQHCIRMEDSAAGVGATIAARALQTGAVTGAGIGLMNLGGMVFGGEADQQEGDSCHSIDKAYALKLGGQPYSRLAWGLSLA